MKTTTMKKDHYEKEPLKNTFGKQKMQNNFNPGDVTTIERDNVKTRAIPKRTNQIKNNSENEASGR